MRALQTFQIAEPMILRRSPLPGFLILTENAGLEFRTTVFRESGKSVHSELHEDLSDALEGHDAIVGLFRRATAGADE